MAANRVKYYSITKYLMDELIHSLYVSISPAGRHFTVLPTKASINYLYAHKLDYVLNCLLFIRKVVFHVIFYFQRFLVFCCCLYFCLTWYFSICLSPLPLFLRSLKLFPLLRNMNAFLKKFNFPSMLFLPTNVIIGRGFVCVMTTPWGFIPSSVTEQRQTHKQTFASCLGVFSFLL